MLKKNFSYLLFFSITLSLLSQCSRPPAPQNTAHSSDASSPPSDSVYREFEILADTAPTAYVANPDSFLNSFHMLPQSVEQQEVYVYGLLYMAYGLREHGDHYNSIRYYEKALRATQQYEAVDVDRPLYIYKPLAALYTLIDDNEKSIQLLEHILQELPQDHFDERAGFVNNLANAYLYNDELKKSEELLLNSINTTSQPLLQGLLYNSLATTYQRMGNAAKSATYNRLALSQFESRPVRGDTLVWYSSALTQFANLSQDVGIAKTALQILQENFPNSHHRSKAATQLVIADLLYGQNRYSEAIPAYQQVVEIFNQFTEGRFALDYKYTHALHALARCYVKEQAVDSALRYFQWAIENDFRTQQLITSKHNQLNNNRWNRTIIEEMAMLVDEELVRKPQNQNLIETFLWCVELSKGRLLINEINRFENWDNAPPETKDAIHHIRQLHQRIAQSENQNEIHRLERKIQQTMVEFQLSERYFETIRYIPQKESFLAQLRDNTNDYFSYFVRQDSSLVVLATRAGKHYYHRIHAPDFLNELSAFKKDYFGDNPHLYNRDPHTYRTKANHLAQQLLPGLRHAQANLHLSLDGDLYGLPFDALYADGYLVERHNMAYLNSFILYDLLRRESSDETTISLLYRAEFPSPLPNLNFVDDEVRAISRRFDAHQIPPEQQDDSTIVREFAATHAIHIAAHTLLDSTENPILYLQKPISTEQLRFYHIHSPLIFLSACNTGSGKALPSEGMESIQRVFLGKGVPSVISTYWFANDEAMLQLTTLFYDQLLEKGRPVVALANAKRLFLQSASVEQQNPWYWANINYAGVDNKVGLKKPSLNLLRLVGIALLTVLIILAPAYLVKAVYRGGKRKRKSP